MPEANAVEYEKRSREQKLPTEAIGRSRFELGVARETGYPHRGVIDFRENRVDTGSGTIRLRAVLDNKDRVLIPGLFARVRVPLGPPQRQLAIPEVALMADQAGRFVYVVASDNSVSRQEVKIGGRSGDLMAVETGLNPDDWVIINGLQKARPGGKVNPKQTALEEPKERSRREVAPGSIAEMISRFFIDRPIFANVIAIVTVLFGVVALYRLPVERYPADHAADGRRSAPTTPAPTPRSSPTPSPRRSSSRSTASENMMYMSSTSSADGSYSLTITFEIGTNLDDAQVLVQNRARDRRAAAARRRSAGRA